MGDGVAERTKASVVTHTGAGSNLSSRAAFLFGQVTERSAPIPHLGMADSHGCPLKNLPKLHTSVYTFSSLLYSLKKNTQWPKLPRVN